MSVINDIKKFMRECADERNIKMFKAGAKAGNATLLAFVDDLHTISKIAVTSEKGIAIALLHNFFPTTSKTIKDCQNRLDNLEVELFPMTPDEGFTYEGNVNKIVKVSDKDYGYEVTLHMKPKYTFVVTDPRLGVSNLDDDLPETVYANFYSEEDDGWVLVTETDGFVYSYVA